MSINEQYIEEKHNQMEKPQKIYISGGITNNPDYKRQFTRKYKELEKKGYIVLTPLFINAQLRWEEYMHIDYAMIDICDAIYMMDGWKDSQGARLEHIHAMDIGLEVIYES